MAKVPSRLLVVDACIAQAAGGDDAVHPTSKHCRDFLLTLREVGHRLAWTAAIEEEWTKRRPEAVHARRLSKFASRWLKSMHARRQVEKLAVPPNPSFRRRVAKAAKVPKVVAILDKDCHLIEAAVAADRIIASIETSCRDYFRGIAHQVAELPGIGWVNPDDVTEAVLEWLAEGARIETCRKLSPIVTEP
jgi:hypothetical protein